MTDRLRAVIDSVAQLPPNEQLELIEEISRSLKNQYQPKVMRGRLEEFVPAESVSIPIKRTPPVQDLAQLKADFWPEEETADDINAFIEQQRREDLLREQNEYGAA
jgi:hypothetical protein